jgi:hypothetical protein
MAGRKGVKPHAYTEAELTFLKLECEMPRKELTEAFNKRFGTSLSQKAITGTCKRHGWLTGRAGQFTSENRPAGGGAKRPNRTSFKKGQKPHTWRPIGTERTTKEGYLQRKVTDTGNTVHDYVEVHRLLWEEHHGPIPEGHVVIFKDGDRTHITLDNLMLISRAELVVLNKTGLIKVEPELKPAAQAIAQLRIQHRKRKRPDDEHNQPSG